MIAQKYRFHGHASLRFVFQHGDGARSRFFAVKFSKNPRRKFSRAAVIVSKKVFKSAVKRNRIRRRIYEIIRPQLVNSDAVIDIAITVFSPEVFTAKSEELKMEILPLLKKAGLKPKINE